MCVEHEPTFFREETGRALHKLLTAIAAFGGALASSNAHAWQETNYVPHIQEEGVTMQGAGLVFDDLSTAPVEYVRDVVTTNVHVFRKTLNRMQQFGSSTFSDVASQEEARLRQTFRAKKENKWDNYVAYTKDAATALRRWEHIVSAPTTSREELLHIQDELITFAALNPKQYQVSPVSSK